MDHIPLEFSGLFPLYAEKSFYQIQNQPLSEEGG